MIGIAGYAGNHAANAVRVRALPGFKSPSLRPCLGVGAMGVGSLAARREAGPIGTRAEVIRTTRTESVRAAPVFWPTPLIRVPTPSR